MPRKRSAQTELRQIRRDARAQKRLFDEMRQQCDALLAQANAYRARATQAEQEAAAWRKRFDRLLGLGLVEPAAKEAKP